MNKKLCVSPSMLVIACLLGGILNNAPTFAAQPSDDTQQNPDPYKPSRPSFVKNPEPGRKYEDTISTVMESEKAGNNPNIQEKVDIRESGRKKQEVGKTIGSVTQQIIQPLKSAANLAGMATGIAPTPETKAGAAIAVGGVKVLLVAADGLGRTVGTIVTAYGRFQEKSQEIASTNEQIIEAANQSDAKIQKLSEELKSLLSPVTVKRVIGSKDSAGAQLPVSKRLLGLFTPSTYANTFKDFTDSLNVTVNKEQRWAQIQVLTTSLKNEQKNYDDLIILLEIKILQSTLSELTRLINKDNTIQRLEKDMEIFTKLMQGLEEQIKILETQILNSKINFLNKRKYNDLLKQKVELTKKMDKTKNEISYYTTNKTDKATLENNSKLVINEISQLTSLTNITNKPDYLQESDTSDTSPQKMQLLEDKFTKLSTLLDNVNQRLLKLEGR